ncbi:MAG TPA: PASTA domain-containing protein [Gaiellaceae bacterium]
MPPPPPPPRPILWPALLVLLLLVVGGLLAAYFLTRDNDHHKKAARVTATTVPGLVGLKETVAVERLNRQGLTPRLLSKPSRFPSGVVFAQAPAAGTQVARHSPVTLSISAAAVTKVPNVVGAKTATALNRLRAAGLSAQVTTVTATRAPGTVVSESPLAGTRVAKGSTVSLRVSKGRTSVPDVRNQQVSTAKALLRAAGLVPAVFHVSSALPKGIVTAERPAPGTKVARGSKVRINVSNGSGAQTATAPTSTTTTTAPPKARAVTVPNVVGQQQAAAQRRLHAAGLGARVLYVASSKPSGIVVSETPSAGSTLPSGSKVTIRVSVGPAGTTTKTVPNVVGQDQQTATTTLQQAGFTVQVIPVPVSDPSQNGIVTDEQPAGGTSAPAGSVVTIYVGQAGG